MGEPARGSFWDAFRSPRLAVMLGLGFASGLPNPMVGDTMSAWLHEHGVSLAAIGLFGFVHTPFAFKFLWAPFFDRVTLPFLTRRRGWIVLLQLVILVGVGVLGTLDPSAAPFAVATLAFGLGLASASQDIVIDAYRADSLPAPIRASGVAVFVAAYRVALVVSGAGALVLADLVDWKVTFWIVAALMSVGIVTTLLGRPPDVEPPPPRTLKDAVVTPLKEILFRPGVAMLLGIVALYRFGDVVVTTLRSPFLLEIGFTLTEIGAIGKGLGLAASIVGSLLGGGLVAKWGLRRAMIVFGIGAALPNLSYAALAVVGKSYTLMAVGIAIDNLMGGMSSVALVAFLMMLCDKRYSAFQYALLSSLMILPGRVFGLGSGWVTEQVGWPTLWVLSVVLAAPALLLLPFAPMEEPDVEEGPKKF